MRRFLACVLSTVLALALVPVPALAVPGELQAGASFVAASGDAGNSSYVATNGNDGNSGTIDAPFATITHAASVMKAGDTCYVRGGTYRERLADYAHQNNGKDESEKATYPSTIPKLEGTEAAPFAFQAYGELWIAGGGTFNAVTRCDFQDMYGEAVRVQGSDNLVANNRVHCANMEYSSDSGGIQMEGQRQRVSHNTVSLVGRLAIGGTFEASEICYNDLSDAMRLSRDGGVIYLNFHDYQNSALHHNVLHGACPGDGYRVGFYIDPLTQGLQFHHNVIYGIEPDEFGENALYKLHFREGDFTDAANHDYTLAAGSEAVDAGGAALRNGFDYTVSYVGNVSAGTATAAVTGKGDYEGAVRATFKIAKAANPMRVTARKATVPARLVAGEPRVARPLSVRAASGALKVAKTGGSKRLSLRGGQGAVAVRKGTPAGTYRMKAKVRAAGDRNHKPKAKAVKVTVVVR